MPHDPRCETHDEIGDGICSCGEQTQDAKLHHVSLIIKEGLLTHDSQCLCCGQVFRGLAAGRAASEQPCPKRNDSRMELSQDDLKEVEELLKQIEEGTVTLKPETDLKKHWDGVLVYEMSNGWKIAIFYDAGSWDYIEWIQHPSGRKTEWENLPIDVQNYSPPKSVIVERYGFNGI